MRATLVVAAAVVALALAAQLPAVSGAPYVRRNQASLTNAEVTRYVNALLQMKKSGLYDQFVRVHQLTFTNSRLGPIQFDECLHSPVPIDARSDCFDWGHASPVFLPWHRRFLLSFERELRKIDPEVALIYWDWTVDNSTDPAENRLFSDMFIGGNGNPDNHYWVENGSFAGWPQKYAADGGEVLARRFGGDPSTLYGHSVTLPVASNLEDTLQLPMYDEPPYIMWGNVTLKNTFRKTLEGFPGMRKWELSWGGYLHARVHQFFAGSMLASTSPNDPIFFLHHANIDRLWSIWQKRHPDSPRYVPMSGGPYGMNADDYLIPWDGKRNTDQYEWHYQFKDAVPEGQLAKIKEMLVDEQDLGYIYEGVQY